MRSPLWGALLCLKDVSVTNVPCFAPLRGKRESNIPLGIYCPLWGPCGGRVSWQSQDTTWDALSALWAPEGKIKLTILVPQRGLSDKKVPFGYILPIRLPESQRGPLQYMPKGPSLSGEAISYPTGPKGLERDGDPPEKTAIYNNLLPKRLFCPPAPSAPKEGTNPESNLLHLLVYWQYMPEGAASFPLRGNTTWEAAEGAQRGSIYAQRGIGF